MMGSTKYGSLAGKRVLVAEDHYVLADNLATLLEQEGAIVIGPVGTLGGAMIAAGTSRVDAAILDIHLHGGTAFAAADALRRRGLPYLFLTGQGCAGIPEAHRNAPCLFKPASPLPAIAALLARA